MCSNFPALLVLLWFFFLSCCYTLPLIIVCLRASSCNPPPLPLARDVSCPTAKKWPKHSVSKYKQTYIDWILPIADLKTAMNKIWWGEMSRSVSHVSQLTASRLQMGLTNSGIISQCTSSTNECEAVYRSPPVKHSMSLNVSCCVIQRCSGLLWPVRILTFSSAAEMKGLIVLLLVCKLAANPESNSDSHHWKTHEQMVSSRLASACAASVWVCVVCSGWPPPCFSKPEQSPPS